MTRRRVRASSRGGYELRLPAEERALLASLPGQLVAALEQLPSEVEPPAVLRRLFPPAYLTDERAEEAYGQLMREDLAAHHREALEVVLATVGQSRLSGAELESWLVALNALRLVLGSSLGVTEDLERVALNDPRAQEWAVYGYLSYLVGEVVDALAGRLPPPVAGAGDDLPEDPWGEPLGDLRWDGTPRPEGSGDGDW